MSGYENTFLSGEEAEERRRAGWGGLLRRVDTVVSTQEAAKELAEQGAPEGTAVMAEEQTGGRGRLGRKWHSPKGKGIWMSAVLRPSIPLQLTPQLTLLAGAAVCAAIRRETGVDAGIKWPNDLLVNGRKLCGILLESCAWPSGLQYTIAGIGISANLTEEDYPEELREIGTSLLIESGQEIDREELARAVLKELETLYGVYLEQGLDPIAALWSEMSVTLGRRVMLRTPEGPQEGTALRLEEDGGLVVRRRDGETETLYAGEIALI
ncbi:biotin--[acetyl-CoA-carboxylase] ligase [Paenibacillus sp. HN-1]|uniref:biotin--[acetyl-CoA-carboxylase] ligase n=1 Tax=Paenibacillus TaxID=44249 RepID=UPI001CA7E405|nr:MULTISPECIES: biotin--[acetyl-CoA-carboxylase] ligase [Paenibacillus]MBY9081681.1 biotin--[acetyl-CoA-carboxylase] ligase [Paenibacillus sp. CGMCC 1.18879]MBY9083550.1 biotin--[acetyl-CoA-carboxylase] ligase [Paenibacillus sinensis]